MLPTRYDGNPLLRHTLWMREIRTFAALADQVRAQPGPVRLVGVDGCGGAGKTTFAARLAAALGPEVAVIHTDDFASHDEPMAWWPAMLQQVVEPLLTGRASSYRPYDWVARRRSDVVTVEPADVVVIEGVQATRSAWRDRLTTSIWIETPRELRLRRGLDRDGLELADYWTQWMAAEDRYVAEELPASYVDLVVDGNPGLPHDPTTEYVVLSERRAAGVRAATPGSATRR
jgi:uridine kinase